MSGSEDEAEELPREARTVRGILRSMGVERHEGRVVNQLLELLHRYMCAVLGEARVFAEHANRAAIEAADVRLAVEAQLQFSFTPPPPRDLAIRIAREVNRQPFPEIDQEAGMALPPPEYQLTARNYQVITSDPRSSSPGSRATSRAQSPEASAAEKSPPGPWENSVGSPDDRPPDSSPSPMEM